MESIAHPFCIEVIGLNPLRWYAIKTPVPPTNEYTESVGKRTSEVIKLNVDIAHSLLFLSEEEGRKFS